MRWYIGRNLREVCVDSAATGICASAQPFKTAAVERLCLRSDCRSEYGFHYIDRNGRTKLWRPDADKIFGTYYVPYDSDDTYKGASSLRNVSSSSRANLRLPTMRTAAAY